MTWNTGYYSSDRCTIESENSKGRKCSNCTNLLLVLSCSLATGSHLQSRTCVVCWTFSLNLMWRVCTDRIPIEPFNYSVQRGFGYGSILVRLISPKLLIAVERCNTAQKCSGNVSAIKWWMHHVRLHTSGPFFPNWKGPDRLELTHFIQYGGKPNTCQLECRWLGGQRNMLSLLLTIASLYTSLIMTVRRSKEQID